MDDFSDCDVEAALRINSDEEAKFNLAFNLSETEVGRLLALDISEIDLNNSQSEPMAASNTSTGGESFSTTMSTGGHSVYTARSTGGDSVYTARSTGGDSLSTARSTGDKSRTKTSVKKKGPGRPPGEATLLKRKREEEFYELKAENEHLLKKIRYLEDLVRNKKEPPSTFTLNEKFNASFLQPSIVPLDSQIADISIINQDPIAELPDFSSDNMEIPDINYDPNTISGTSLLPLNDHDPNTISKIGIFETSKLAKLPEISSNDSFLSSMNKNMDLPVINHDPSTISATGIFEFPFDELDKVPEISSDASLISAINRDLNTNSGNEEITNLSFDESLLARNEPNIEIVGTDHGKESHTNDETIDQSLPLIDKNTQVSTIPDNLVSYSTQTNIIFTNANTGNNNFYPPGNNNFYPPALDTGNFYPPGTFNGLNSFPLCSGVPFQPVSPYAVPQYADHFNYSTQYATSGFGFPQQIDDYPLHVVEIPQDDPADLPYEREEGELRCIVVTNRMMNIYKKDAAKQIKKALNLRCGIDVLCQTGKYTGQLTAFIVVKAENEQKEINFYRSRTFGKVALWVDKFENVRPHNLPSVTFFSQY